MEVVKVCFCWNCRATEFTIKQEMDLNGLISYIAYCRKCKTAFDLTQSEL